MVNLQEAKTQYDRIAAGYKAVTETDPIKQYVQYPETIRLLGDVAGLNILDVGCGNGIIAKKLAINGAQVLAYDISEAQLKLAQEINADPNIEYIKGDFTTFTCERKFDKAVSAMVLAYANDEDELYHGFETTWEALKPGAEFVLIIPNSNFWQMGKTAYNRKFYPGDGGSMKFEWYDSSGNIISSGEIPCFFTPQNYQDAAKKAGFSEIRLYTLMPNEEAYTHNTPEFWNQFIADAPFLGLVAKNNCLSFIL